MMTLAARRLTTLALLAAALAACGARTGTSEPSVGPDVPTIDLPAADLPPADLPAVDLPPPRLTVTCPARVDGTQGTTVTLAARAESSAALPLTYAWTVERAPTDSTARPAPPDQPTTRFTFDAGGEWLLRFTARDSAGNRESCTVAAAASAAIDLVCPNEQSGYQGATVPLVAAASSRLGLPLSFAWSADARPAGSATAPSPADALSARLLLDALGDWRLRLTARDTAGHAAACATRVHADPDVVVTCPPDDLTRPFATRTLAATARSRLGLGLTYRWEIAESPITSTASLGATGGPSTSFTFDVAGRWTFRFTATNARGDAASCTTRVTAASDEAVRVELVWNTDRSCRTCNPQGGGLDLDLHLADVARSGGHWNRLAPERSDCYWENCKCAAGGAICADGVIEWPPAGAVNNPQLDVDHNGDLPGPENINVLRAAAGSRFDVGVHFFGDNNARRGVDATSAVVRVYCAGAVVFESEPVRMGPVSNPSVEEAPSDANPLWRVGQVAITARGCEFTRCGRPGAVAECIRPARDW